MTALGFQAGVIVALTILVSRARERLTRLEEWVRIHEADERPG
jgi:hypothetical protein